MILMIFYLYDSGWLLVTSSEVKRGGLPYLLIAITAAVDNIISPAIPPNIPPMIAPMLTDNESCEILDVGDIMGVVVEIDWNRLVGSYDVDHL
ncbi:hypothetical protein F8M41_010715 [Gigaspora margarita]|uniref:Uncharacterized protein n=1 Tax=Gigaspora margarita TaxID=4874 RepID=A0A8H3X3G5_GIGMA|nr:hypothetical protein F8M41_010715 [Gigaspora margarita]